MNKAQNTLFFLGIIILLAALYPISQILNPNKIEIKEKNENVTPFKNVSLESIHTSKNTLSFFENKGQIKKKGHDIRYMLEANGVTCYLKPDGIIYSFMKTEGEDTFESEKLKEEKDKTIEKASLLMHWKGVNPNVTIKAEEQGLEVRHYYNTGTPAGITGVKSYGKIIYENIYDHIDLVFYTKNNELKYDFVIKPGGNLQDIQLAYSGNDQLSINPKGELVVAGKLGELKEGKPYTYQIQDACDIEVGNQYKIENGVVTFEVGDYDKKENLIIDPTLLWATYYGVTKTDEGLAVCTDPYGNVYLAGLTHDRVNGFDPDNIPFNGHDNDFGGEWDAFLVKFDATGNRLWATYYGGNRRDAGQAVSTDAFGNVYLAGYTDSKSDIAYNGHDNIYNETANASGNRFHRDAFLAKFNSEGIRQWATYYGGEDGRSDVATGVCTDNNGNVFLTGYTNSTVGIAFNGHDNSLSNYGDAFLVKFNSNGIRQWGTYLGKLGDDRAYSICSNNFGNIFIAGNTESPFLGHSYAHDVLYAGKTDAFLAKFDNDGDLKWCTYYGGSEKDEGQSVATDLNGNIYLAGLTQSDKTIAFNGHDESYSGGAAGDAFLVKFNFLGVREWGTYYGGSGSEANTRITVNKHGDVFLTGSTSSVASIATNSGIDQSYNGSTDGYLVRFNNNGQRQWGTYYGGNNNDTPKGITTDISANIYICGLTYSFEGISQSGHQNERSNPEYYVSDAFLAKFKPYATNRPPGSDDFKNPTNPPFSNVFGKFSTNGRFVAEQENNINLVKTSIYPNPVAEELHITLSGSSALKTGLEIMDMSGKKIFSKEVSGEINEAIDVRNWQKGVYLIKLKNAFQEVSRKIVVE
ncbi:MAG: SBBP repeat-containing protein [Bacteroidota bacterium]